MPHSFGVTTDRRGGEYLLRVTGEMDLNTCPRLDAALHLPTGCTAVLLDLSEVSFMDSSGLNLLLRLRLRLQRGGVRLHLTGLAGQPRGLFDLVGAHEVFGTADHTTPPRRVATRPTGAPLAVRRRPPDGRPSVQ
jgi:anti-sigma B factor antagonist